MRHPRHPFLSIAAHNLIDLNLDPEGDACGSAIGELDVPDTGFHRTCEHRFDITAHEMRNHVVSFTFSPLEAVYWRLLARLKLVTAWPPGVYFISGSRPKFPTITNFWYDIFCSLNLYSSVRRSTNLDFLKFFFIESLNNKVIVSLFIPIFLFFTLHCLTFSLTNSNNLFFFSGE